jgi:hypothetical protein
MHDPIGASGARCNLSAHATASLALPKADNEAVALTLFDGAHTTLSGEGTGYRPIQPRHRGRHVVGLVSDSRVEPSTSARSNVTVPVGSPLTPRPLQSTAASPHVDQLRSC